MITIDGRTQSARAWARESGLAPSTLFTRLRNGWDPVLALSAPLAEAHGETSSTGKRASSEYSAWRGMLTRCYNPGNKDYARYGARGIRVCVAWRKSFSAFLCDMGRKPSPRHSIDRIDGTGNYEPANCRWATALQQVHNSRAVKLTPEAVREIRASTAPVSQLAKKFSVCCGAIRKVLKGQTWSHI